MSDDIDAISQLLFEGKIVLCPTDTIWGLSCDAFNESSVDEVFKIKKRNQSKRLILLVDSLTHLKKYIVSIHPRIENLIYLHQRPITIIYKANKNLPKHLVSEDGTIAIRITKDPILVQLIQNIGRPIVSTSANREGEPGPKYFDEINKNICNEVDYVFVRGRNSKTRSKPSLLIKYNEEGELHILR